MKKLTLSEAVAFLKRIDAGLKHIHEPVGGFYDSPWSNMDWEFEDGWHLIVFNDCGEWDYIDSILHQDQKADFDDWNQWNEEEARYDGGPDADFIRNWIPSKDAWKNLGLKPEERPIRQ